jgi:hydroxyethylthiazole kinase-like uncharacterized protein yjeF
MPIEQLPHASDLYRTAEIREIEATALVGLPPGSLMRAAGKAAANLVKDLTSKTSTTKVSVLVLCGPRNNGGDALETACLLALADYDVSIVLCGGSRQFSAEAQLSLVRAQHSPAKFIDIDQALAQLITQSCSFVIDGLFGIGLSRPITGSAASMIVQLNRLTGATRPIVVALDIPSGLDADSGQIIGDQGVAVRATHTITFIANKPGLHTGAGRDYAGSVTVANLQISSGFFPVPQAHLIDRSMFAEMFPARAHDSNKGSFGNVAVIGGAAGMTGAPLLSARAAIHCGAGRVYLGFVGASIGVDSLHPELMCRQASELDVRQHVVVIGPGLGDGAEAEAALSRALTDAPSIVIDADALNLIAIRPVLQKLLTERRQNGVASIITPHPLEAARLLALSTKQVQADRWRSAERLAQIFNATVILKGSGSIVATPDAPIYINSTGNPALATAGTGDVLAGICGALLAQGMTENHAATAAVWLHGLAADNLVEQGVGPVGLTASELIPAVRRSLNQLINAAAIGS